MTVIRSTGIAQTKENILLAYPVPRSGMVQTEGEAAVPKDGVWVGRNVHNFYGECRQRPSWNGIKDAGLQLIPRLAYGAGREFITSAFTARRANTRNRYLIVGGSRGAKILQEAASGLGALGWRNFWTITDPGGAAPDQTVRVRTVRFAELAFGTPLVTHVVATNGVQVPQDFALTALTANFGAATELTCAAPWLDICMTADRIIGITETEASWGEALRLDIWPDLNHKSLAETLDFCVAIRPIGTLHVAIWKERSIWLGQARGGSSASFFTWKLLKVVDGPLHTNALVPDGQGNWWWMTRRGRIARMDSTSFQITYPCDGAWPFVRNLISPNEADWRLGHAAYDPFRDEIHFFYPDADAPFTVDRGVTVCGAMTNPIVFVTDYVMDMLASATISETAASSAANNTLNEAITLYQKTADPTNAHLVLPVELSATGDDLFTAEIRSGVQPAPGGDTHRIEAIEPLLRRAAGSMPGTKTITVAPVTSNILDVQGATLGTAVAIPALEDAVQPVKAVVGLTATGRFLGFQLLAANANSILRFMGAILHGRRQT